MTPFTYQRGETILLALDAVSGDPLTVGAVTAQLIAKQAEMRKLVVKQTGLLQLLFRTKRPYHVDGDYITASPKVSKS